MSSEEEKGRLRRGRGTCKSQMTFFKKYLDSVELKTSLNDAELCELSDRLSRIELVYEKFEGLQNELELYVSDDELNEQLVERSKFEDIYFSLTAKAKILIKAFSPEQDDASGSGASSPRNRPSRGSGVSNEVKLPVISLPKFSGDYKTWLEFRDIFSSLIHENGSLSPIQKFHYLRASLQDAAAQVIRSLDFSGDNYSIAWTTLCDRYDNNRLLVHMHLKALFDLEPIEKESAEKIRYLIDNVSKNLNALTALKQETDRWGTIIMYLVSTKLDPVTDREWEEFKSSKTNILSWSELKEFLRSRADVLETLERRKGHDKREKLSVKNERHQPNPRGLLVNEVKCGMCKGDHFISSCKEFAKLSTNDRFAKAKQLRLCLNCLKGGHYSRYCRGSPCAKCKVKHNVLLHFDVANSGTNSESRGNTDRTVEQVTLSSLNSHNHVFLSTVVFEAQDKNGIWHIVRAILDSGSQSSFITAELCNKLGLIKEHFELIVGGLSQNVSKIRHKCKVHVRSLHSGFNSDVHCLILPQITGLVPSVRIDATKLDIPRNIKLADPSFYKPSQIDILIGNELFYQLLCIGQISLGPRNPILQKTRFGWIVSGPIGNETSHKIICNLSANVSSPNNSFDLRRFWEIENEFPNDVKPWSNEENECERIFQETFRRDSSGRFIVSMPLKGPLTDLGESKDKAMRRFLSLERKFQSCPEFKQKYVDFVKEYQNLGHMSEVAEPSSGDIECEYYMPHHGVMKEDSLTTKLRVVFDCSMQTSSGRSLNDLQMVGPVLQSDLIDILLRFREHRFVISADIAKMYRQVLVEPSQRPLQSILWRESPSEPIKVFNLNTVTYGQASASFLAVRCVWELAKECKEALPDISKLIETSLYMDDLLCSVDSIEQGIYVCKNISEVLEKGCFVLRKWISNEPKILEAVRSHANEEFGILVLGENENTKTLGLTWSCVSDRLTFKIRVPDRAEKVTKRNVLSHIAHIFDPLGLLSPCIVVAKLLLQKLWLERLSWDEALPTDLHNVWLKFCNEFPCINELNIPRQVTCKNITRCEIHGFSDASNDAYGGAIYLRSVDYEGNVTVRLFCAKGRVSPLKPLTTPRLEICGALVLARLADRVLKSVTLKINRCIFWSDSTIVLGWLRTPPNMLKTFVCSRVAEIQTLTKDHEWRHISTKDNPADVLSRGIFPKQIVNLNLWWNGPSFLAQEEDSWPKAVVKIGNLPELRPNKRLFSLVSNDSEDSIFDRFSSFTKLKGVVAWMLRFVKNCRLKSLKQEDDCLKGPLVTSELDAATILLVKMSQKTCFAKDYSRLEQGVALSSKSKLLSLNPFIDEKGILRVGGRLRNAKYNYDKKHPMLISSRDRLARLIFESEHARLMHAGPHLLLSVIREKYWPIAGRNLAKGTVRRCLVCCRFRPKNIKPIMGDLPESRLVPGNVFDIVGIDYMGPLQIRDRKGRGARFSKCYVSLFVCFSTKALHIEVVSDLTTEAFVLAFRRFVARRGKPSHVYSDNGTNFVGANHELNELGKYLIQNCDKLSELYCRENVQWHFIPSHSPHFGGLWEAGVKSVKHHLKRVSGNAHLTFEELTTLLSQIESILNSRPLTPLSTDPNDYSPLTPAHFLLGKGLIDLPDPDVRHVPESRLSVYQRIQQLKQHFWCRWNKEYVSELQQRVKWKQTQSDIQPGSLVLIKEDNTPPLKWRLGRIESVLPGRDRINRVANIKTANGVIRRSFSKICPLPCQASQEDSVEDSAVLQGGGHVSESRTQPTKARQA